MSAADEIRQEDHDARMWATAALRLVRRARDTELDRVMDFFVQMEADCMRLDDAAGLQLAVSVRERLSRHEHRR